MVIRVFDNHVHMGIRTGMWFNVFKNHKIILSKINPRTHVVDAGVG